jgi:hypothetical protein
MMETTFTSLRHPPLPVSIIPSLEFSICFGFSASEFEFHCDSILIATQLARH